jgi:hypothetical protein
MGDPRRRWVVLPALLLFGGAAFAWPQDAGAPVRSAAVRLDKVKRFYSKIGYAEKVRVDVRNRIVRLMGGDAKRAAEVVAKLKWAAIDDLVVREMDKWVDEATVDEMLPFLETPEGQKALALLKIDRGFASIQSLLGMEPSYGAQRKLESAYLDTVESVLQESAPEAAAAVNEALAIAALRNIASCQEQVQTAGVVDCDEDGIGEYATFLEMSGAAPRRTSAGWSPKGRKIDPPILSPVFADVNSEGLVVRRGYCYRIFLPDDVEPYGFVVHEKGPASAPGLAGGKGEVCADLAETSWCAYAWPLQRGVTGTRVFFVSMEGDVLASSNEVAKWSGPAKAPPGNSALAGPGLVSGAATDKKGRDGDTWRVVQ